MIDAANFGSALTGRRTAHGAAGTPHHPSPWRGRSVRALQLPPDSSTAVHRSWLWFLISPSSLSEIPARVYAACVRKVPGLTEAALHWEGGSYRCPSLFTANETNLQVFGTFTGQQSIKCLITPCIRQQVDEPDGYKSDSWSSNILVCAHSTDA